MAIKAAETPGKDLPFVHDDARYVEIWNLVFMQFDRSAQGELALLPKPSIDTGMGLERTAAVLQGKLSNFETDLFVPLIEKAAELTHVKGDLLGNPSLRIIADHARAATFLISDGVLPSNEGRGYVLRKIMRRGIRHGRLLGQEKPFLHEMVFAVRDEMQAAYPELKESAERVSKVVLAEEEQFARVMVEGMRQLDIAFRNAYVEAAKQAAAAFAFKHELKLDSEQLNKHAEPFVTGAIDNSEEVKFSIFHSIFRTSDEALFESFFHQAAFPEMFPPRLTGSQAFRIYETFG